MTRSNNKRNASSNNEASDKRARIDNDFGDALPAVDENSLSATLSEASGDSADDGKPEKTHIDSAELISCATRPYFNADLVARLNILNAYHNPTNGCATLRTIEFHDLAWGNISGERGYKPDFLYYQGNLLTVWVIGEVTYRTFVSRGYNVRHPTVRIRPLLQRDMEHAVRLQNKWSKPKKGDEHDYLGIWANRWMGDQSMTDDKIPAFERVFDAMDTYRRKADMDKYPANDLNLGDIVLAELFVTRWTPKQETEETESASESSKKKARQNRFKKAGKRDWKVWNVEFRLDALSLLCQGSEYYTEQPKPDEDVEL